jgi:hypothetical protein
MYRETLVSLQKLVHLQAFLNERMGLQLQISQALRVYVDGAIEKPGVRA